MDYYNYSQCVKLNATYNRLFETQEYILFDRDISGYYYKLEGNYHNPKGPAVIIVIKNGNKFIIEKKWYLHGLFSINKDGYFRITYYKWSINRTLNRELHDVSYTISTTFLDNTVEIIVGKRVTKICMWIDGQPRYFDRKRPLEKVVFDTLISKFIK